MIKRRCKICDTNRELKQFATYRRQICLQCDATPAPDKALSPTERGKARQRGAYYHKILRETGEPPKQRKNPNVSRGARMNPILDFSAIDRILAGDVGDDDPSSTECSWHHHARRLGYLKSTTVGIT